MMASTFNFFLSQISHRVFCGPFVFGANERLTRGRGFTCLGLFFRGRLISFNTLYSLEASTLSKHWPSRRESHWAALQPLGPSLILQGSCGQYGKIDPPLQSNKLLNALARQLGLTLYYDYSQLLILWFRLNVEMLDIAGSSSRLE